MLSRKPLQCLLGTIFFLQQITSHVVSADPVSECPPVPADIECSSGEPVVCGSEAFGSCVYDNICAAQRAHKDFGEVTCRRRKLESYCPAVHKPVECKKGEAASETFTNLCFARGEGYEFKDCCNVNTKICPEVFKPVDCRGNGHHEDKICEYENMCVARGAGYQKDDCIFDAVHGDLKSHECEAPSDKALTVCKGRPENEIFCGPKKCPMNNVCVARQMGFKKRQCTKENDCLLIRNVACNKKYRPVKCGKKQKKCQYDNLCIATRGAGYKKRDCIPVE